MLTLFFMSLVGFSFFAFALVMIFGGLMGEAGLLVAAFLAIGGLFALLICIYEKLSAVEGKLDKLMEQSGKEACTEEK